MRHEINRLYKLAGKLNLYINHMDRKKADALMLKAQLDAIRKSLEL